MVFRARKEIYPLTLKIPDVNALLVERKLL